MINQKIKELTQALISQIEQSDDIENITETINFVKQELHKISPFKQEPVDCVVWVKQNTIHANSWNPNHVAPPEMKLLYDSIKCDGYTQPIVTGESKENEYEIIDGFHRNLVLKKYAYINHRTFGYLPITVIDKEKSERIASTIRHNRARGTHEVELMGNIVKELHELGRSDSWIAKHLGMDTDEILRLKQITGLAALFKNKEFSQAWKEEIE